VKTWQFLLELGLGENRSALEYSLVHKAVTAIQANCVPAVLGGFSRRLALGQRSAGQGDDGAHQFRSTCTQMRQAPACRRVTVRRCAAAPERRSAGAPVRRSAGTPERRYVSNANAGWRAGVWRVRRAGLPRWG